MIGDVIAFCLRILREGALEASFRAADEGAEAVHVAAVSSARQLGRAARNYDEVTHE